MGGYRYARQADHDLASLIEYSIEAWGERIADRYVLGLFDRLDMLGENPALGRDYSHVLPGLLRYEHRSHSVYFQREQNGILVIRILGAAQDPSLHIQDDSEP
jgi:toxin ParE1/3/4